MCSAKIESIVTCRNTILQHFGELLERVLFVLERRINHLSPNYEVKNFKLRSIRSIRRFTDQIVGYVKNSSAILEAVAVIVSSKNQESERFPLSEHGENFLVKKCGVSMSTNQFGMCSLVILKAGHFY